MGRAFDAIAARDLDGLAAVWDERTTDVFIALDLTVTGERDLRMLFAQMFTALPDLDTRELHGAAAASPGSHFADGAALRPSPRSSMLLPVVVVGRQPSRSVDQAPQVGLRRCSVCTCCQGVSEPLRSLGSAADPRSGGGRGDRSAGREGLLDLLDQDRVTDLLRGRPGLGTDGAYIYLVAEGLVDPDGIHPTGESAERMATLVHDLGYDLVS